jgi:CubicO group peptidase (beta-lactamase class C family)
VSGERALPEQASLRYLKLEAKRRVAAGEFPALHDAQLAIAREHGQPSWAALRGAVAQRDGSGGEGHAVTQLRWIIARFSGAAEPGWAPPDDEELRAHFTDRYLAQAPPGRLVGFLTDIAKKLSAELTIDVDLPFSAQGRLAGHLVTAVTENRPPYRLLSARMRPLGESIGDPRAASPGTTAAGNVPGRMAAFSAAAVTKLGLVGLALAGGTRDGEHWAIATGWADLERAEPLEVDHAFPAHFVTTLVTAIAVLRLAADGRLRLDDPANKYLASVQLSDDKVTIRDLLAHTGGVAAAPPAGSTPLVPELADVTGPVLRCSGRRGAFDPTITGYAVLGEVIAGLTGETYPRAATALVLEPLGMRGSWFPDARPEPDASPGAHRRIVTGYDVAADGAFTPVGGLVSVFPAAEGLWTTAGDLVRLGLGWSSLLPRSLAEQTLRPHAVQPNGIPVGLCWAVNERAGVAGLVGDRPGAAASLLITLDGRHAGTALTNVLTQVEQASAGVLRALGGLA